jgi:hypothetical protein
MMLDKLHNGNHALYLLMSSIVAVNSKSGTSSNVPGGWGYNYIAYT